MRVLAYELRRLRGLRSTWLILLTVLLCDAAVTALMARQIPSGPLSVTAAVRAVTAAVPLLPLPIAALGAGALGALSYAHEVRWPGLPASRVSFPRRIGALIGKLAVIGPLAVLLALATLATDLLVLRFTLPAGVDAGAVFDPSALRADLSVTGLHVTDLSGPDLSATGSAAYLVRAFAAFALLVLIGAWAGLLITSLVRSAAAALLVLCVLPALTEPAVGLLLRRSGRDWPGWVRELMPFQYGLDAPGAAAAPTASPVGGADLFATPDPTVLAVLLAPAALLLVAVVAVQLRRRTL